MMTNNDISVFWFRRDLRLHDNAGLYQALKNAQKTGIKVLPIFIFDKNILDKLQDPSDARVTFLHQTIIALRTELNDNLHVFYATAQEAWQQIAHSYNVQSVFTNHDYEPYAQERDEWVRLFWAAKGVPFQTYKDHVIFEKSEIVKDDGKPYTVFTPYSRKWLEKWQSSFFFAKAYPTEKYIDGFLKNIDIKNEMPSLSDMGFEPSDFLFPSKEISRKIVKNYHETRDFPANEQGTSRLGLHFRFGTISIREKATAAQNLNETYLKELIWRDFYAQILWHFPHVANRSFRPEYDGIEWRNDEKDFEAWKTGKTGYPIVDAGMRELNATGYMHNRVRMIVASFLTKHLLIDWRWGEAYFAEKLLDFDLASNSGGWQWAAGCGTDAAPYFRIFSPSEQQKKFDAQKGYICRWVKEFGTSAYPLPIVDHAFARNRCLEVYKKGLQKG